MYQGTLLGVLLFLIMINDLKHDIPTVKFVDDTSAYDASNSESHGLQVAATSIDKWSNENDMKLNCDKTKETVICFNKTKPELNPIIINDSVIGCVPSTKLIGVIIPCDLS